MISPCEHENRSKNGKTAAGTQRYKCKDCGKTLSDERPLGTMTTDVDRASMALGMLLEGMSIAATARMTGLNSDTVGSLILVAGEKCGCPRRGKPKHVTEAIEIVNQTTLQGRSRGLG